VTLAAPVAVGKSVVVSFDAGVVATVTFSVGIRVVLKAVRVVTVSFVPPTGKTVVVSFAADVVATVTFSDGIRVVLKVVGVVKLSFVPPTVVPTVADMFSAAAVVVMLAAKKNSVEVEMMTVVVSTVVSFPETTLATEEDSTEPLVTGNTSMLLPTQTRQSSIIGLEVSNTVMLGFLPLQS